MYVVQIVYVIGISVNLILVFSCSGVFVKFCNVNINMLSYNIIMNDPAP